MLPKIHAGGNIIEEGRNCWRIRKANRAAFLIDSASYFIALADSLERAERQALIVGWDIDSRVQLIRGNPSHPHALQLGEFLQSLVSRKPRLHIYMLCWDFAFVYAFEREFFPLYKLDWAHRRLHFQFDGNHPLGASHHQKIVVIDDKVAFSGGIDLANRRWDRPEHKSVDLLRVDAGGKFYHPTHDVQMLVDGPAAAALGELARERWRRVTSHQLRRPTASGKDAWPASVAPSVEDVDVAIARTEPKFRKYPEVREVERLYLDTIASAKRFIYLENQYFTSAIIGAAISSSLQEENGPEIVLIAPERSSGWLSESTMDVCRTRLLRRLRERDPHRRLRLYFPVAPGLDDEILEVHSKVFIADDDLARVGSANLCDRSLGLDTECDLAIEARGDMKIRRAIAHFRNYLLGQHLGVPEETVAQTIESEGSLIATIEKLRGNERTLVPLEREAPKWLDKLAPGGALIDPERPFDPDRVIQALLPKENGRKHYLSLLGVVLFFLIAAGLAGMWRWTALGDWFSVQNILIEADQMKETPLMPLLVYAFYLVGGLVFFPVMVMIVVTAIVFEPLKGFWYSLSGCLLSASFTYFLGRTLGRNLIRRLSGSRANQVSQRLGRNGLTALLALRVVPVAPFTAVNLVAGASHIKFGSYFVTTFLGMFPGIFAITILGQGIEKIIRNPTPEGFVFLAVWLALTLLILFGMRKWVSKRERSDGKPDGKG
jgi:phosphatidylserine/phosphatidylglycerophosphate/cardiolipin synthase-like enzyme/uncharacterized membrane protein YdjX (TVP38/TMEM64 family)